MDRRRLTGIIALIAVVVVVAVFAYLNNRQDDAETTTAFAPSQSADESVPPPETQTPPRVVILEETPKPEQPAELAETPEPEQATEPAQVAALDEKAEPAAEVEEATSEPVAAAERDQDPGADTDAETEAVDPAGSQEAEPEATVLSDQTSGAPPAEQTDAQVSQEAGAQRSLTLGSGASETESEIAADVADQAEPAETEVMTDAEPPVEDAPVPDQISAADSDVTGPEADIADVGPQSVPGVAPPETSGPGSTEVTETPTVDAVTPPEAEVAAATATGTADDPAPLGEAETSTATADSGDVQPTLERSETVSGDTSPPAEEVVSAETPPAPATTIPAKEEEIAPAEIPAEVEVATGADLVPDVIPSFSLVRVEPSGDMVVAGLAEPSSTVEVLDGPKAIAEAEANDRGEWALVLDHPLPPGSHDLAIRTTSRSRSVVMLSDERVAIFIPEPGEKDVLVVVNTPDAASDLVQVPEGTAEIDTVASEDGASEDGASEDGAPEVAALEIAALEITVATPVIESEATVADAADDGADALATPMKEEAAEIASAAPVKEEATETVSAATAAETTDAPAAAPPAAPVEETDIAAATPDPAAEQQAAPEAVAEAPPEPPPEPVIQHTVSVTAVEADSAGALFVAGVVQTSEPVRVYVGNDLIGQARPSPSGTWLVEVQREMPPGAYDVRADQVDRSGEVLARAEVPFRREVEVAELEPISDTGSGSGAKLTGTVPELKTIIIKRGDNLWRISRRTYGHGIRFSTIYQANRDQISNPRWIFPGQVFVLPAGNVDWDN